MYNVLNELCIKNTPQKHKFSVEIHKKKNHTQKEAIRPRAKITLKK